MIEPAPSSLPLGTVLAGKYRVERVIGQGGMGVVYCAQHMQLDERVAIKLLLPEALTEEAIGRFVREARAAVKIKSEHVAHVLDVGQLDSGAPYIVMEYLEGGDLADWLRLQGTLALEQAVEFMLQACEALAEAHALGIVHRDLKPSNLFWVRRADGLRSIKVLDFGISKLTNVGEGHDMTRTAAVVGSPHYMSPEQMQSSRGVDARTDVWSIGVMLYELLSGRVPFDARSITELAIMVVAATPQPLRELRPDLPPAFEHVVMRCLEKDRDRRYGSVAEVALAMAPFGPPRALGSVERIQRTLAASGAPAISGNFARESGLPAATGEVMLPRITPVRTTVASWGTQGGTRGPGNGIKVLAVAGATVVAGLVVAGLVLRSRPVPAPTPTEGAASIERQPAVAPGASSVALAEVTSLAPTPEASTAVVPPPAVTAAPAARPQAPTRPARSASPPPATSGKANRCTPPYFLDAEGLRQYKPECL